MNTFQMFSTNVACCKLCLSLVYQLETQAMFYTNIYTLYIYIRSYT